MLGASVLVEMRGGPAPVLGITQRHHVERLIHAHRAGRVSIQATALHFLGLIAYKPAVKGNAPSPAVFQSPAPSLYLSVVVAHTVR